MTDPVRAATLLVTVTGRDRPGVTSALFTALGTAPVEVLDVEQVVIRGRLILGVLVSAPPERGAAAGAGARSALVARIEAAVAGLGMEVEASYDAVGAGADAGAGVRARHLRSHVTVLGAPLRPAALAGIAGRVADIGANIDRIVRIARYPVTALELEVSGVPPESLQLILAAEAAAQGVDVAVQRSGLHRRAKRLVVMDVDSTLVQGEVIEMLAEAAGCQMQVAAITAAAMRGELDFAGSLRARVTLLAGLPEEAVEAVRRRVRLAPGARTLIRTLKRLDHRVAIVSGGFSQVTDALAAELGLDYSAANTLEISGGRLTGHLLGPVVDRAGKADALERFAAHAGIPLSQTVAIGDGANDLDMIARAGLGVAFNAKPVVRQAADTALNVPYLDAILFLLGIPREEVEDADAADNAAGPAESGGAGDGRGLDLGRSRVEC
jgi:phosphoserine phosphatase